VSSARSTAFDHLFFEGDWSSVPDHRHLGKGAPVYASFKFFLYTLLGPC
jgi:hypothetical protein